VSGPVLITGGSGQLARALEEALNAALDQAPLGRAVRVGRPEFDFDRPETLAATLDRVRPALVINAAAYTAVDRAETEPEAAARANQSGPGLIARWCAAQGVPLIHVSTDYVFDGAKGAPYVETDAPNPTGVYGATKLAGEREVLASGARAVVLRTSWVYGASGKNFVLTMLNARAKTDRLRVVADQIGCPTATPDLAAAILGVAARIEAGWREEYAGVFHAAGSGATSWHGLASAVFEEAARHGVTPPTVEPIATADWPTPAQRPADSRLDCGKLARVFGVTLPPWRDSLKAVIDRFYR